MAIQLGSAYGKVSLDVSGLVNAVRTGKANLQQLALVGGQVGAAMQDLGQKLMLGVTLPIVATGAAAIKAASSYEETKNKAIVVFEEMADSVIKNAERAANTLGMNRQQYLDYASSLGAAFKASGMSIKESTALAEQAVKHFADLASFHDGEVADIAAAWQSAIRGQYEPIQRYFPFITDAYLKTYGIANGMIDANTKNLTSNQRAIILNAIALDEELNPALDDFAETSDSLANQLRELKANFGDALIELGENLLPVALKVVKGLNDLLEKFNNLPEPIQDAIIAFAGLAALLAPILYFIGGVVGFVTNLITIAGTLGITAGSFAGIGAIITGVVIPALVAVAGFFFSVVVPILIIIGTLYLLYLAFKNNFMGITDTAKQLWFILKYYFSEGWKTLLQVSQQRAQQLLDFFKNMAQRIRDSIRSINWQEVGQYIVFGLSSGMLGGIPLIISAATKIGSTVLDTLKKTLDSRSPSRKTMLEGLNAAQGFMQGIDQGMDPRQLTRVFMRPVEAAGSTSVSNTLNFSSGLTLRDADRIMSKKIDDYTRRLNKALG